MVFQEAGSELTVQGPLADGGVPGIPLTVGLTGGGYVVIWQTTDAAPPGDVYARIYNAAGTPQGAAFKIFDDYVNFGFPRNVDAVALPNGGFAITSVHVTAIDSLYQPVTSDIVLQLFSATGAPTTGVITASPTPPLPSYQTEPAIAVVGNQLVLTWDAGTPILAQKFDFNGQPVDPYVTVSLGQGNPESPFPTRFDQRSPVVTGLGDGGYLFAFRQGSSDAGDITYALFGPGHTGSWVTLARAGVQATPHAATLANGDVILTWADYNQTADNASVIIRGQLLSPNGTPIGGQLLLARTNVLVYDQSFNIDGTTLQDYGLTALAGGGFALSWASNRTNSSVSVQEFNSNGVALRDATVVSNVGGSLPHISALAGGGYEVVWSSSQTQAVYAQTIADTRTVFASGATVLADFNAANGWTSQNSTPRHVADMNGDGYADIIGFGATGMIVSYGSASGTFARPQLVLSNLGQNAGWSNDDQYHRALADLNGDGQTDVIGFGQYGTMTAVATPVGTFQGAIFALGNFGVQQGWTSQDHFTRLVGDVNGDGKADIVGFGQDGTLVALEQGSGMFGDVIFATANFGVAQGWTSDNATHRTLADVNGDGNFDIVGFGNAGTYVALSNGDGSFAAAKLTFQDFGTAQGWTNNDGFSRIVVDVNGDGKADIVGFSTNGVLVAFGNGDGTFQPVRDDVADFGRAQGWTSDNLTHRELADINHDGQLDIVGFGAAGVSVGFNQFQAVF